MLPKKSDQFKNERNPRSSDEDFISDSKKALISKTTPITHIVLITIIILLGIGLIWAYFASIETLSVGMGKVIPSSQIKIIQSLDGGIVKEILVRDGEIVKENQVLMKLDDTRYKAEFSAGYAKYLALLAMVSRLRAEAQDQKTITFPEEVKKYPALVNLETRLFDTRKKGLEEELSLLQKSYDLAEKQVNMYSSLLPKGYVSQLEYYRSLQNATDAKTKIAEKQNAYLEKVKAELTDNEGQLSTIKEQLLSLRDKMVRTTLYSPVYGIVKQVHVVTVGGVVTPGMNIMEIVPLDDKLLVEARIKPSDIAFIKMGQPATVKITAYDFSIYGGLPGRVEYISADTVTEEPKGVAQKTGKEAESYYLVNVRTDRNYLGNDKHKLLIMPGMVATVHIKTGKKTVLQYLLKPLIKAKEEALRER